MDIEDLLDAVFDVERLTNRLASTADQLEALVDEAEQEAMRLRDDFNAAETRLEALDETLREKVLGGVQEKLDAACKLLGDLVDAADPEKGLSVIEPVLDEFQRRFGNATIAIPAGVQEGVRDQVREYEKKILARIGLDPKGVEDLIERIADACSEDDPAQFGSEERQGVLAEISEFRDKLCALCREGRRFLSLFTLEDIRNIVGGLRDVCVLTIDATAVVTTPDITLITLFTSAKSIKKAGSSIRGRVEQLSSTVQSVLSKLNIRRLRELRRPDETD